MIQNLERNVQRFVTEKEIESVLTKLVSSSDPHFKWLNTLSLMEHIGARKIHLTQTGHSLTDMVLRHAAEEARHASYFKKLALRILPSGEEDFKKESLLIGFSAVSYFQKLDSGIDKALSEAQIPKKNRSFLCYLYVTKMIEERAGTIYEIYDRILNENRIGISIGGIIKEEENHLYEMDTCLAETDPQFEVRTQNFRELEEKLFYKYFQNLKSKLQAA